MTDRSDRRRCGDFGGRTAKGDPCSRAAGWGTDASDGPCKHHQLRGPADFDDSDWWDRPEPPETLSVEAQRIWRTVVANWQVGPEALPILRGSLEQFDLYRLAMQTVKTEGMTVVNPESGNVKRHPAAYVANNAFNSFRLAMKQLGLEPLNLEEINVDTDPDIIPFAGLG